MERMIPDIFNNQTKIGDKIVYLQFSRKTKENKNGAHLIKGTVHAIEIRLTKIGDTKTYVLVERDKHAGGKFTTWLVDPVFILYKEPTTESNSN